MGSFVHLHVHTEYSLLDGSARIKDLVKRTKELNMDSIAITDHGVMYGVIDFYKACRAEGIKPIIGCEIYVAPRSLYQKEAGIDNEYYHLVLLAKNNEGYKNLMKIDSKAFVDGFYYKPRADYELLKENSNGIIALSACLGGEIQSLILKNQNEEAEKKALFYNDIFGSGNFYLELQDHGLNEQAKVNKVLMEISQKTGIPLVATNDVHYISREDSDAHEILLCIQTGKTIDDDDRMRFNGSEYYLKSPEEMQEIFDFAPEAIENTVKIAEKCNVEFEFHKIKLPKFDTPEGYTASEYLRKLCSEGLKKRFGDHPSEAVIKRLNYELSVIEQMGYVDYFLIVWDFIRFARENKIMTGPGRGSGAGSIVAYTLEITKINPIKYNLIFERFLNPERISMPDIDSDFCYERRQEVIDYVVRKYGKDRVAQIVTFGTMAARGVIRDVGRALNYSYSDVDAIAKMIPMDPRLNITIDKALELNPDFKKKYETDEEVKTLVDFSKALEGLPRNSSTHAAGVVISSAPVVEYVPLARNNDTIVTQFTMTALEELGLLKMDFLGLRTLTVIRDAVFNIERITGKQFDINSIDYENKEVYQMISQGHTEGVFQLESRGMTSFMKELKPDSLEDIIAGISLYRPGPMNQIPMYIKNKNNPENIQYLDEKLRPILDVTYGCIIYQEQVMQIVRDIAGYSLGRSDLIRRAMAKKKHAVMEEERKNFINGIVDENGKVVVPGAVRNGVSAETANKLFDIMMDFASYAFNKAHAAAYAVVAYQTAYLRKFYPVEFMAAMLTSVMGVNNKVAFYIDAAKKMNIDVLPPDVNESFNSFTVVNKKIRFGLAAIKNVGSNAIKSIIESREKKGNFKDIIDFCEKVDLSEVNKRTVESMIKAGAFDSLKATRKQLISCYEKIMDSIANTRKKNLDGQMSLFANNDINMKSDLDEIIPDNDEYEKRYLLAMEKEMTGLYISGNPLDDFKDEIEAQTNMKIAEIVNIESEEYNEMDIKVHDGQNVSIAGILDSINIKSTKKNDIMAFAEIEDVTSSVEVIIFPKVFEKCRNTIIEDNIVLVKGRISIREEEQPKVIASEITTLKKQQYIPKQEIEHVQKLFILLKDESWREQFQALSPILKEHSGNSPVCVVLEKSRKEFRANKNMWVSITPELLEKLKQRVGSSNVKSV